MGCPMKSKNSLPIPVPNGWDGKSATDFSTIRIIGTSLEKRDINIWVCTDAYLFIVVTPGMWSLSSTFLIIPIIRVAKTR